ncbi:MAG: HAMP domain-containing histidine kinase [Anaerolineales bacterium]|nr:HAMP domain-containing histidine kinase [Anaerolineales bacterium]
MHTLRTRIILSHILPLLVVLLLIGVTLDYVLETRILLPILSDELINEAKLFAEMTKNNQPLWDSSTAAQDYLNSLEPILDPFVTLLDSRGQLLASTDPLNAEQMGTVIESKEQFTETLARGISIKTTFSRQLETNVVEVMVPAMAADGKVIGVVRMTYHLENVYGRFLLLRYVIVGIVAAGTLLGVVMALLLALNFSNALQRVTHAVQLLATGQEYKPPIEQGPEEIRVLLRSINSLVERLRDLENMRRKLLTNLIHELGRPLGALLLAIQALQAGAGQDGAMRVDILAGMEEEMSILQRLLDDLTGLHNQLLGVLELKTQPFILTQWLPNVLRTHQEAANVKGLHWQVTISEELPTIEADPDRLAQAVGNLVNNAIKFTPSGGTVSVNTGVRDNEVWIRVNDTGTGIPLDEQANIFTPFYRGRSENRFPQGRGLGLSIAHDLIVAHRGRLEFTSVPGEGSSFTIWLAFRPNES